MLSKKHRKKKRRIQNLASVYTEDLGDEGIKKPSLSLGLSQPTSSFKIPLTEEEEDRRNKRMKRFGKSTAETRNEPSALMFGLSVGRTSKKKSRTKSKSGSQKLVGTSKSLEKPYLRLTTFPKAENVRPLAVLQKSVAHIKSQFIQTEDFDWANEQFKSVRQDITVQRLRNKFVLEVYETHARILLEHGDLNEFNQCQTMIRTLTTGSKNLDTKENDNTIRETNEEQLDYFDDDDDDDVDSCLQQCEEAVDEFQAYSILYSLVQRSSAGVNKSLIESTNAADASGSSTATLGGKMPAVLRGSSVRHAFNVVKAVVHHDYQTFFRLYESAPHLSAYLMDFLVRRVRHNAFLRIIAAYRPSISVEHFREALCFQDLDETRRFLRDGKAIFIQEQGGSPFWVDCKATFISFTKQNDS